MKTPGEIHNERKVSRKKLVVSLNLFREKQILQSDTRNLLSKDLWANKIKKSKKIYSLTLQVERRKRMTKRMQVRQVANLFYGQREGNDQAKRFGASTRAEQR
jgi:hypothetical protein